MYDAGAAFRQFDQVDWTQTANAHIGVGDNIYLYGTDRIRALTREWP